MRENARRTTLLLGLLALFVPAGAARHVSPLDIEWVSIPAGKFTMGTPAGTKLADSVTGGQGNRLYGDANERPAHTVAVDAFDMMKFEVTNALYEQFDPSHKALRGKLNFSFADDEAVIWVTWHNATAFASWLTKTRDDGYTYELPTEEMWEYACRAGTTTAFSTGDSYPVERRRDNVVQGTKGNPEAWWPNHNPGKPVANLTVGTFPPNPFGLHDMHGNVEEWTSSRFQDYSVNAAASSEFYVSRGGSHGTPIYFLRSAARFGALPFASNWLIGFRLVRVQRRAVRAAAAAPEEEMVQELGRKGGVQHQRMQPAKSPYFRGPLKYVNIPSSHESSFPFGKHNHDPAITFCPHDGSMLAVFFSTWAEPDRECGLAYSRLEDPEKGTWSDPKPFYDTPGRLDTGPAFLWVENNTKLLHWVAVAPAGTWGGVIVYQRHSYDCGRTWSATYSPPGFDFHGYHSPAETALQLSDGRLLVPTDDDGPLPTPSGPPGPSIGQISRFYLSSDGGGSWAPSQGSIRGHHGSFVELKNSSLWGIGRNEGLVGKDGLCRMPQGTSDDGGRSFRISATSLPNIVGGQRMVSLRLIEGPIIVVSFANGYDPKACGHASASGSCTCVPAVNDKSGRQIYGLFVALSEDEGTSFSNTRLITDGAKAHPVETTDGVIFQMDSTHSEPRGYISAIQDPSTRVVHVITSRQHYQFNIEWIRS